MHRLKRVFGLICIVMLCFGRTGFAETGKPVVMTTVFPLYDFAREVAGDRADVELLLPPGVEPHSYEPTPADIVKINGADIFFYIGESMEPWVASLLPSVTNQNMMIVEAMQSVGLEEADAAGHLKEGHHEDGGEGGHHHDGVDPHIWMDFEMDQKIVDAIVDALSTVDPDGKQEYTIRAADYKAQLMALDRDYADGLRHCQTRTIVYGGHFAFGYLAKRYALEHDSPYAGFSPDAEPGPRALAELITKVKRLGIKYVYYEELLSPRLAETIAAETGAVPVLLHAAHNVSADELARGVSFLMIMKDDLKKLQEGLGCR